MGDSIRDAGGFEGFLGVAAAHDRCGLRVSDCAGNRQRSSGKGYGCIDRLQRSLGSDGFNNLFDDVAADGEVPAIDFAAHGASLGAHSECVGGIPELESALEGAKARDRTSVIVIDTDPAASTGDGGAWWDVAVAETSDNEEVNAAREAYVKATVRQRVGQ